MAIIIKNVWVGSSPLKGADKFNVYAWCALGHRVDIYTHHLSPGVTHSHESLGLIDCDQIGVADIGRMLLGDSMTMLRKPASIMAKERALIQRLLSCFPTDWEDVQIDGLYNLVDMCKSYFGATRRGIVLDLKVGPSEHLQHYEAVFGSRFISYTRGNQSFNVENQCMGTMQDELVDDSEDALRVKYARKFVACMDRKRGDISETPNGKHYNEICRIHGQAWTATGPKTNMNVETEAPDKGLIGRFTHSDFVGPWTGPFRVLKEPSNQTHKLGSGGKDARFVQNVCASVLRDMLRAKYGPLSADFEKNDRHDGFEALMKSAIAEIAMRDQLA